MKKQAKEKVNPAAEISFKELSRIQGGNPWALSAVVNSNPTA